MRILYGVQGTGNGHVSRCRSMARALSQHGVEVDYVMTGRSQELYFDMQEFGSYRVLPGLSFATRDGQIDLWRSLCRTRPVRLVQDIRALELEGYDRIISDFEPVTAWAAKRQGIASLGISHQAAFAWPVPRKGENWSGRLVMRHYAPVQEAIGLHWFHFGCPILPPIIDALEPQQGRGEILVYLPFESVEAIKELLSRFSSVPFVCFHPDFPSTTQVGNIAFHPLGREHFKLVLSRCAGVISNAGFELASEALVLGKKLLLKPVAGQFEQASNALTLELLGLARVMESLDAGMVRSWLDAEAPGRIHYPDVADALAAWLAAGGQEPVMDLAHRLWRQVTFPETVAECLGELGFSDSLSSSLLLRA